MLKDNDESECVDGGGDDVGVGDVDVGVGDVGGDDVGVGGGCGEQGAGG